MSGTGGLRFHLEGQINYTESPGWLLDPVLICLLLATLGVYLYETVPIIRRRGWGPHLSVWRPICLSGALIVLAMALLSPLDGIGERYLFWVHMVQHMTLTLVVAPLILLGLPGWMVDGLVQNQHVRGITRRLLCPLLRPLPTLLISQSILIAWHVPAMFELALRNAIMHDIEHLSFMVSGILMWWPILSRSRVLPRSEPIWLIPYLFILPIPTAVLGALITFSRQVIYETYALAPRLSDISALQDQELSGLLMWVPGKLLFWVVMGIVFYQWFSKEGNDNHSNSRLQSNR